MVTRVRSGRLIIVSNRLPVTVSHSDNRVTVRQSSGGLATGLRGPHERSGGIWIGWPGNLAGLDPDDREEVERQLAELRLLPVALSEAEQIVFYEQISNGVLWPVCHDRLDQLPLRVDGWDVYEAVNARFADRVAEAWRPGDTIWVHDYQLFLLPQMLRARLPHARIGFFLHVPFPNPEIFFALPTRRMLLEGIMGADLVGFHTRRWRGHFGASLRRLVGLELSPEGTVEWDHRTVSVGIFPMGVDVEDISERAAAAAVSAERLRLRYDNCRLILGVDRLDYSKGVPRRLLAFERLLQRHPEWREKVRLIQVAVPSRGGVRAYRRFRREIDGHVGRINGDLATPTWTPISYLHRSVSPDVLLALYRAADVMLVTPLRDGMNLVCKEFAASRLDEDGVLVLSEFAGAADEMQEALLVNPYDVDGVADMLHAALTMPGAERRGRMRALRAHCREHNVHQWASRFLGALASPATPRHLAS